MNRQQRLQRVQEITLEVRAMRSQLRKSLDAEDLALKQIPPSETNHLAAASAIFEQTAKETSGVAKAIEALERESMLLEFECLQEHAKTAFVLGMAAGGAAALTGMLVGLVTLRNRG